VLIGYLLPGAAMVWLAAGLLQVARGDETPSIGGPVAAVVSSVVLLIVTSVAFVWFDNINSNNNRPEEGTR